MDMCFSEAFMNFIKCTFFVVNSDDSNHFSAVFYRNMFFIGFQECY